MRTHWAMGYLPIPEGWDEVAEPLDWALGGEPPGVLPETPAEAERRNRGLVIVELAEEVRARGRRRPIPHLTTREEALDGSPRRSDARPAREHTLLSPSARVHRFTVRRDGLVLYEVPSTGLSVLATRPLAQARYRELLGLGCRPWPDTPLLRGEG